MSIETASFDQHGEAFWDMKGPYRTLHHINPARLRFIQQHIALSGQSILDIGCGGGILTEALVRKGAKASGIDLSSTVLQAARAHAQSEGLQIDYREVSTRTCVENGEQYDHITCMEMLEHVMNPASILRDIHALLKPGGYAFLSTLNRNAYSFFTAIVVAEWLTNLVPKGTHNHADFIRPQELVAMAENSGLEAVALCGMDYHPLLKKAFLSRHLKTNYLLAVRKPLDRKA